MTGRNVLSEIAVMRTDRLRMNVRRAALLLIVAIITASCSKKLASKRENDTSETQRDSAHGSRGSSLVPQREAEPQPEEDQVAEDCAAFVRATKVVRRRTATADCPECPAEGTEVLSFRKANTEAVSCSGDSCNVVATIRAVFNPGSGETMAGGLIGWIPPEERSAYLHGQTPSGEQIFRVQITYKRRGNRWQAVEFDRAARQ